MDAYEILANAIITQAANDYRKSAKFLKKHPRTKELEDRVATRLAEKKQRRERYKKGSLPVGKEKKSKEERLLDSIRANEQMVEETERFFHSKWFTQLTSTDGHRLFAQIKQELEDD